MSETAATMEETQAAPAAAQTATAAASVYSHDGRRIERSLNRAGIQPYNFRNPGFQRQGDLRQLETIHQKFADHLAARLSTFLRMECGVRMTNFTTSPFNKIKETMKESSYVTLFQVDSLRGIGILDMSMPLSLAIADRLLGGKGKLAEADRGLTEIETALLEDVTALILGEWARQLPEQVIPLVPAVIGHDTSGRFLQTSDAESVHLSVTVDVAMGDGAAQMQIYIPVGMIEPLVKAMAGSQIKVPAAKTHIAEWRSPFNSISVPVIAEWAVRDMAVSDVLALRPGDVLEMNRNLITQTHVKLSNTTGFIGTAGVEDGRVAVQLTHRKTSE